MKNLDVYVVIIRKNISKCHPSFYLQQNHLVKQFLITYIINIYNDLKENMSKMHCGHE
jgi:hypothetical protein